MGGQPANNFQVMQGKFRNDEMVSGWTEELIEKLASDIEEAAEKAVLESGVFHLAVSGGASPLRFSQTGFAPFCVSMERHSRLDGGRTLRAFNRIRVELS
ncbi:hypothetical protein WMY93_011749 [Mugilogobius chulae]|uniref:Uncharacterized protein n=1 Tax=Mugilogobius chulae TaxID=88201 RepID=A0AAW0P3G3_9GOBI